MKRLHVGAIAAAGAALVVVGVALALASVDVKQGAEADKLYGYVFAAVIAGLGCLAWTAHRMIPAEIPAPPAEPAADAWDRATQWCFAHGALAAVGVVTIVLGIVYGEIFYGETNGDDLTFHMAESARIADCIRAGDWDFWNPSGNSGYASAYYYQVIPQLISALPAALFDHHLFFFQLSLWLPHVLGPLAAYQGARLLGATPWQAFGAAVAIAFLSGESRWGGGPKSTFGVGLYTQSWALATFPLALGYGGRWIASSKSLAAAIAWGTFVGLCHPFGGVSLGLALFVAVLVHTVARREVWQSTVLGVIVLAILAALAAAIYQVGGKPTVWAMLLVGAAIVVHAIRSLVRRREADRWREDFWIVMGEPARLVILGLFLALATLPGWITMLVDYEGFGGFPHRVNDEVGPGFRLLGLWYLKGALLDFERYTVLTWALPFALVLGRGRMLRWLWPCAFVFAFLLGVGPHMGKTTDDLIPPVRFLGAMQTVLAMGIGASLVMFGQYLWSMPPWLAWLARVLTRDPLTTGIELFVLGATLLVARLYVFDELETIQGLLLIAAAVVVGGLGILLIGKRATPPERWEEIVDRPFGVRTVIAAGGAVLLVLLSFRGVQAIDNRISPITPAHRQEIVELSKQFEALPQGRKQSATGAESHHMNLLPYVYARRPALLQMGGGGLQASPNYDFVFSVRDLAKLAWVFDSPYILFNKTNESTQPAGETVGTTTNFEIRKLRSNGLVSPVEVVGVLPPGPARAKTPARAAAIEWLRDATKPYANQHLAYAPKGQLFPWILPHTQQDQLWSKPDGTVLRAWRQDSPGDAADIYAELDVKQPTTFVIRESWHPRWRAYLDGKPVPIRRLTPDFPAVDVPDGKHWLALRFERPWWAHASWVAWPLVSLLGWLLERRLTARGREAERSVAPSDPAAAAAS